MQVLLVSGLSFVLSLILYPLFIKFLNKKQHQQIVSEFSLDSFKAKAKTPSLGGVLFVLIPVLSLIVIYPNSLLNTQIVLVLLVYVAYGLIGFIDDYKIILERNNKEYRDWETDRKSTRLNSSHITRSRMPSSA